MAGRAVQRPQKREEAGSVSIQRLFSTALVGLEPGQNVFDVVADHRLPRGRAHAELDVALAAIRYLLLGPLLSLLLLLSGAFVGCMRGLRLLLGSEEWVGLGCMISAAGLGERMHTASVHPEDRRQRINRARTESWALLLSSFCRSRKKRS